MNFWDASAVVPLLTDEAASAQRQRQAERGGDMLVWWGTSVECLSAVQRAVREGKLSPADAVAAIGRLHVLQRRWTEIEPNDQIRQLAERLLRTHPLRAADALQLAAAIIGSGYDPAGLPFLTADTRLAEAAAKEGFKVA